MPLAARVADFHSCPASTGPVPHVGGLILPPCSPNVQTNSLPQARATDQAMCAGPPDVIVVGSSSVTVNDLMAARIGDPTMHGGVIAMSSSNVEIGGPPAGVTLGNPDMGDEACRLAAKTRAPKAPSLAPFMTPLQQSWGDCGPESARQIINTVHGTKISQEELLSEALITGISEFGKWYQIGGVTPGNSEHPQSGFVDLLQQNGVPATELLPTSQNLIQAIGERRGVIALLMAGTLWGKIPGGPNPAEGPHAVLVTGVRYDAAGKVQFIVINDTGKGSCTEDIPVVRFMQAVDDYFSGVARYVVTDNPIW